MKFPLRITVLVTVFRPIAIVLALVLAGCAARREIDDNREITAGFHQAGSAIDGDYLVRNGATLHTSFASNCRFYVEAGGALEGLDRGLRECVAYAEKGARVPHRTGLQVVTVKSARQFYRDRDNPVDVNLRPGPGGGGGLGVASAGVASGYHRHRDDDDDDDDDDHYRRRSKIRDVKISDSSYKKKKNSN